jgi:thymidylate kinase
MGNEASRGWRLWGFRKHRYIALLGIDSAGKTTVRNWLVNANTKGGGSGSSNVGETVPTLESSFTQVAHKSFKLMLWVSRSTSTLWGAKKHNTSWNVIVERGCCNMGMIV